MFVEKTDDNGYYRIPSIVTLSNGDLLACYECRKPTATDWGYIDIKIIKSVDDGQTWRTVKIITSGETMNNPVLTVCGEVVHLTYCKNYHDIYHLKSLDFGESFSDEKLIPITAMPYTVIAVGPGHGICHSGKIIMPIWFVNNLEDKFAHSPSKIATIYSSDGGETWTVGEVIGEDFLINPSECALAVTADNKVLISIRNENPEKLRAFAISENGFSGWQDLALNTSFIDPICQGSMVEFGDTVCHINCANTEKRRDLTVKIIDKNLTIQREIYVENFAGYSDIAVKDNKLFVLYENMFDDWKFNGLIFKKIDL